MGLRQFSRNHDSSSSPRTHGNSSANDRSNKT